MSENSVPQLSSHPVTALVIAISERVLLVVIAIRYLMVISTALAAHPIFILAATSEILAAAFILVQKNGAVSTRVWPVAVAYGGTLFGFLVRPGGLSILPANVAGVLMALGLLLSVSSKLALNRSFGLVAANRGVKRNGPYRIVRHPMYLGYIINQIGFLSQNVSALNLSVYVIAWTLQLLRIRAEEEILERDEVYQAYRHAVRWRLIPGVI